MTLEKDDSLSHSSDDPCWTELAKQGSSVRKDDTRVETLGALDEAIAILGVVRAVTKVEVCADKQGLIKQLETVQHQLFELGTLIASSGSEQQEQFDMSYRDELERWCAELRNSADKKQIEEWSLPGNAGILPAMLHWARTVVRRSERRLVRMQREIKIDSEAVAYLNELSTYLFMYAKFAENRER